MYDRKVIREPKRKFLFGWQIVNLRFARELQAVVLELAVDRRQISRLDMLALKQFGSHR